MEEDEEGGDDGGLEYGGVVILGDVGGDVGGEDEGGDEGDWEGVLGCRKGN